MARFQKLQSTAFDNLFWKPYVYWIKMELSISLPSHVENTPILVFQNRNPNSIPHKSKYRNPNQIPHKPKHACVKHPTTPLCTGNAVLNRDVIGSMNKTGTPLDRAGAR